MSQQPPRYGQRDESPEADRPVCPRHPDTVAYVTCRRCGRPVCPQCQVSAPVGVLCTDCARDMQREGQAASSGRAGGRRGNSPFPGFAGLPVTWSIIIVTVAIFVLQSVVSGQRVLAWFAFAPGLTTAEPWRVLTAGFVHSPGNLLHIGLNMYTLYLFGAVLEPRMGRWRFLLIYLLSIIGGSLAVDLLADPYTLVVGASGGVFGLFGALFAWTRFRGGETKGLLVLVAINLVFGFVVPGIAWQAHIGGLVVGTVLAFAFDLMDRSRRRRH